MGGTIPVLTQALSERLDEATRVHARVYAFNTAGAFCGALAGAFVLIPLLGVVPGETGQPQSAPTFELHHLLAGRVCFDDNGFEFDRH